MSRLPNSLLQLPLIRRVRAVGREDIQRIRRQIHQHWHDRVSPIGLSQMMSELLWSHELQHNSIACGWSHVNHSISVLDALFEFVDATIRMHDDVYNGYSRGKTTLEL